MKNRIHYAFTSLADTVSPFRPSLLVSFLMYTTNIECSPHHFRSVPIQLERHSSTCCHDDVKLEAFFKCHTDDILAIFWSSSPAQKKHTHTHKRAYTRNRWSVYQLVLTISSSACSDNLPHFASSLWQRLHIDNTLSRFCPASIDTRSVLSLSLSVSLPSRSDWNKTKPTSRNGLC